MTAGKTINRKSRRVSHALLVSFASLGVVAACSDPGPVGLLGGGPGSYGANGTNGTSGDASTGHTGNGGGTGTGGGGGTGDGTGGGNGTGGGTGTGTGTGTGGTSSDGGAITDGGSSTASGPEKLFRALQAGLVTTCGGTNGICHVAGTFANNTTPAWLANPDPYVSAKAYPGVITADPYGSKLITKGPHEGPGFTGNNKALGDSVMAWLTAEANAITATALPSTDPVAVVAGANTIDISKGGTNVTGAKITFSAAVSASYLTLTNMKIVAPAANGIHIAHPIFAAKPTTGALVPDNVDSFSNLDQTVGAGVTADLGVGTLILQGWTATDQLVIELTTLASATVVDAGVSGCKSVATFTANAVPAIQNNTCLNCHNTGGSGNGALDLSQVGKNNTAACAQALNKVNLAAKATSPILTAPTGGIAAHPYKNAPATYTTMMNVWINSE